MGKDGGMSAQERVRPPGSAAGPVDAAWVRQDVARWIAEEPVAQVLSAFGGGLPDGPVEGQLAYLEAFSTQHWEFRQGRERDFIENVRFPADVDATVLEAAELLGLRGTTKPERQAYDHVLVLGGLVRACLVRPRFAASLVAKGLKTATATALSAYRALSTGERELLEATAPGFAADNEMQVMAEGMRQAFQVSGPPSATDGSEADEGYATWTVQRWDAPDLAVQVVVAPSPDSARRANTADTYAFWADSVQHLSAGDTVLLVTSSIYVPFQGADAVRVLGLPRGVLVEAVGVEATGPEFGPLRQDFRAAHFLQEIRSAVRSARALYESAAPA
jgi:hypothetical protein